MKEILTAIGSTYAITSKNGCTVTYPNGDPIIEVPAGQQTLFIAQSSSILVSDEEARVTACGGSATLNFTSAAPSILSEGGSTGGLTANERALLMGAAQRGGDNTFSAANTFTGSVDMSTAQVTPPSEWNVGELTAEQVKEVTPIAWSDGGTAFGVSSYASTNATALGYGAEAYTNAIALGYNAKTANGTYHEIVIGQQAAAINHCSITIGSNFGENVNGSITWQSTKTEGTGSITIGAGANTLNNGTTESSNSVTIGCKASNQGADSVVIGAQARGTAVGCVVMGAGASTTQQKSVVIGTGATNTAGQGSVCIGNGSSTSGYQGSTAIGGGATSNYYGTSLGSSAGATLSGTAIGNSSTASGYASTALGANALAKKSSSIAIGYTATVNDIGTIVFAVNTNPQSTADAGWCKTQFYIAGANTPLAIDYEDGEAMMGYVVTDSVGKKLAAGTQKLSALFPNNSTFQPATVDENGEWVMPKVFHPSDLDMPTEEPSEVEEYQPLPVWPIVEPEIEEEI